MRLLENKITILHQKLSASNFSGKSSKRKMRDFKSQAKPNQAKPHQAKPRAKTNQTTPNQASKGKNQKNTPPPPSPKKTPNHPHQKKGEKPSPANINNCYGTNWTEPLPGLFYHLKLYLFWGVFHMNLSSVIISCHSTQPLNVQSTFGKRKIVKTFLELISMIFSF